MALHLTAVAIIRSDEASPGARRAAGQLEAAALGVLQAAGSPLTPARVRDELGDDLAYTTVVTILSRLHAKGVLTRQRSGRAYSYAPVADEPIAFARPQARAEDRPACR